MNVHILTLAGIFLMAFSGINIDRTGVEKPAALEVNAPVKTIVINSDDQMKFDLSEIRVKAGEKIKLTLNHTGKLPVNAMGHNFVLLTKGTDVAQFAQQAMKASDNEYIPSKGALVYTDLIGGGESTSIEFTAPAKGTYDFICSFPGHYAMMKGKFIVE